MPILTLKVGLQVKKRLYDVQIPLQLGTYGSEDGYYFRIRNICTSHFVDGKEVVNSDTGILNRADTFHRTYRTVASQMTEVKKEFPALGINNLILRDFGFIESASNQYDSVDRDYSVDPLPNQAGNPIVSLIDKSTFQNKIWDDTKIDYNTEALIAKVEIEPLFDFDLLIEYQHGPGITAPGIIGFIKTFFKATPIAFRKLNLSLIRTDASAVY